MEASRLFSARSSHRHEGRMDHAEVTIRAEPCPGESLVVLSDEALDTLRAIPGGDFEHHWHCVRSAVMAQIDTVNVAGDFPQAGAASFRAEVVKIELSGDPGREVTGFLLTIAAMDAIGHYLVAWEEEQPGHPIGTDDQHSQRAEPVDSLPADFLERLTEDDFRIAVYLSVSVTVRADLAAGLAVDEIRARSRAITDDTHPHAGLAREALDDALAGRPERYRSRP